MFAECWTECNRWTRSVLILVVVLCLVSVGIACGGQDDLLDDASSSDVSFEPPQWVYTKCFAQADAAISEPSNWDSMSSSEMDEWIDLTKPEFDAEYDACLASYPPERVVEVTGAYLIEVDRSQGLERRFGQAIAACPVRAAQVAQFAQESVNRHAYQIAPDVEMVAESGDVDLGLGLLRGYNGVMETELANVERSCGLQ